MGAIGEPKRKVEYWPLETPVPSRRAAPAAPPAPTQTPTREPVPAGK